MSRTYWVLNLIYAGLKYLKNGFRARKVSKRHDFIWWNSFVFYNYAVTMQGYRHIIVFDVLFLSFSYLFRKCKPPPRFCPNSGINSTSSIYRRKYQILTNGKNLLSCILHCKTKQVLNLESNEKDVFNLSTYCCYS